MSHRLQTRSDLYVFAGYVLLVIAVALNPYTVGWWQELGIFPTIHYRFLHANDVEIFLPLLLDLLCISVGLLIVRGKHPLRVYLNDSPGFNLFMFFIFLGILLCTNVILPGKFRFFRILLVLVILFFMTNALYRSVVKRESGSDWHAFYRNLALIGYGLMLVFLLLEVIFMFVLATHRFNGTLASRSWFMRHWELNAEGYRDPDYGDVANDKRRKVMVLGDSFVSGHGLEDVDERFSNRLDKLLGEKYRVFNLGINGVDVRDAHQNLLDFPHSPDILIYSYYPNDIENDGARVGLILQKARSYTDVIVPVRFLVRRSYLLNYLYWMFPHPDELSDYGGYLRQCYAYKPAMDLHKRHLDRMVDYADDLGIPLAVIVFPLLDMVEESAFATEPVRAHFESRGVPVLDVRRMVLGRDPADLVVNRNDAHPGAELHRQVADSLAALLEEMAYIEPLDQ